MTKEQYLKEAEDIIAPLYKERKIEGLEDVKPKEPIEPKTSSEALLQLEIAAKHFCSILKADSIEKCKNWSPDVINGHLKGLQDFIDKAKGMNYVEACKAAGTIQDNDHFMYLRWINGYYKNLGISELPRRWDRIVEVVGKYVMFYDFLIEKLSGSQDEKMPTTIEALPGTQNKEMLEMKEPEPQKRISEINGPVVALFCSIVNQSNISIRKIDESVETFILRVWEEFKIPLKIYPAKARQPYNDQMDIKERDKNLKQIQEKILPHLDDDTIEKFNTFLINKNGKNKIYG